MNDTIILDIAFERKLEVDSDTGVLLDENGNEYRENGEVLRLSSEQQCNHCKKYGELVYHQYVENGSTICQYCGIWQ